MRVAELIATNALAGAALPLAVAVAVESGRRWPLVVVRRSRGRRGVVVARLCGCGLSRLIIIGARRGAWVLLTTRLRWTIGLVAAVTTIDVTVALSAVAYTLASRALELAGAAAS